MASRSSVLVNGGTESPTGQIINAFQPANLKPGKVIDGFVSRPSKSKPTQKTGEATVKSAELHNRAQKARTLMRSGLKKPLATHTNTVSSTRTKMSTQLRAKTIGKHSGVNHFGNPIRSSASHADVKAVSGEVVSRSQNKPAAAATAPLPSMIVSASHQKLERLLDEALAGADAHKQALRYQAARHFWQKRWFSGPGRWIAAGVLAVVMLGAGAYAWRNVPQLSVKAASMQAHVSASVPSYKPEGYKVSGPAKAVLGAVVVKYISAADQQKTYDITQQPSTYTSTLVSQNVVPKGAPVQTSTVNGNTVYIYGNTNDAAWVNNGVLYTIKNHSGLNSDQLFQIVSGLNP
ncbi:DUF4367 domain-containing protein [Candidatus Saccharibacteria bacterium]|nr:DUF4367 domain-containing protein [Candidatus Saccharibacteria bacterium]